MPLFAKSLPRYDGQLELTSERFWYRSHDGLSWDDFCFRVHWAAEAFKERTGVQVELLGRSGRHVCVPDTPQNSKNFRWLQRVALQLADVVCNAGGSGTPE